MHLLCSNNLHKLSSWDEQLSQSYICSCHYNPNPTKNTLAVKKVAAPEKDCYKKDVKSKGDSQGLCRNAVDHIKNFDNDDPRCHNIL